jgi:hypothetical protein
METGSRSCHPGLASLRAAVLPIVMLMVACGGGGSDEPAPPPGTVTPPPPVATQGFKLVPAKLGLAEDDYGVLVALAAPGAVVWSSSDPGVASVDAQGRVKAITKGSATIRATAGTDVATATLTVYRTTGANPDPSSEALIGQALAGNRISAEQALGYRVFALFGDARLPAEFAGAPSELADHLLLREVSGRLPQLSQATQDQLRPFLIPPIYPESWFAQQLAPPVAVALAVGRDRRKDLTINCFFGQAQLAKRVRTTAHFNIHTFLSDDLLQGDNDQPTTETVSDFLVSVIEEVYQSETALFQRFPLPDTQEACNGGDGALDIYIHPLPGRMKAQTVAYPGRCNNVPAFIVLNSSELFLSFGLARNSLPLAQKKKEWKSYIAHEFLHALQFGMNRQAACDDYSWFDEATAQWVMDHVEPQANFEDGGQGIQSSGHARRNGKFFANYLYNDHRVSIETPHPDSNPLLNGYGDYIFFQYVARTYQPETIKRMFDASLGQGSVEAVDAGLQAQGGMKAVWPAFARTLWNDDVGHVLDDWSRIDQYDFGLAAIYSPSAEASQIVASGKLKPIEVDQKGHPRETFKLLKNALERPGGGTATDYYEIQPRSLFYEHLKFSDASVHSLYFSNPVAVLPEHSFMKVQALKKIGGQWRPVEDWTDEPFKQFCLDKRDERLEELLIIVSNGEARRGIETPFRMPKTFPMQVSTSNVGCWKWQGTASSTLTGGVPQPVDVLARGTVTLEVASLLPGRIIFETNGGVVNGRHTGAVGQCGLTAIGADKTALKGVGDGRIDLNLDLDLGFGAVGGEPPDRKLITLSGASVLSTTTTLVCPTFTQVSVGDSSWDWLRVDDPSLYTVSVDGQVIEGRFTSVVPGGATIDSVWRFTAVRE